MSVDEESGQSICRLSLFFFLRKYIDLLKADAAKYESLLNQARRINLHNFFPPYNFPEKQAILHVRLVFSTEKSGKLISCLAPLFLAVWNWSIDGLFFRGGGLDGRGRFLTFEDEMACLGYFFREKNNVCHYITPDVAGMNRQSWREYSAVLHIIYTGSSFILFNRHLYIVWWERQPHGQMKPGS